MRLSVSLVTFRSDPALLAGTLHSLNDALIFAKDKVPTLSCELHIVENEHRQQYNLKQVEKFLQNRNWQGFDNVVVEAAEANLGYGAGHNKAIASIGSDYHLVLNPDVAMAEDSLGIGLAYMQANPQVGLVNPAAVDGNGVPCSLCKRFPRVTDLLIRGFAPASLKQRFSERLGHYEMHDLLQASRPVTGIEIVSGCCMLMRSDFLLQLGGFDDSFFLYFEDFDLSLRMGQVAQVAYVPAMSIVHYGGNAAKKGARHILLFGISALRFYRRYGWRW
jgi:GT2 family glycosyltransferase